MAATVVSVVIFLCGVLVGRGVRTERDAIAQEQWLNDSPTADAQPPLESDAPFTTSGAGADRALVPPSPLDDIGDIRPNTPFDTKAGPAASPKTPDVKRAEATVEKVAASPASQTSAKVPAAARPTPVSAPTSSARGATGGWVVQVAAVNTRGDADGLLRRLATKGYDAYIATPAAGTAGFRVRVGSYGTKREADVMADKLGKDLQLKPWVTR